MRHVAEPGRWVWGSILERFEAKTPSCARAGRACVRPMRGKGAMVHRIVLHAVLRLRGRGKRLCIGMAGHHDPEFLQCAGLSRLGARGLHTFDAVSLCTAFGHFWRTGTLPTRAAGAGPILDCEIAHFRTMGSGGAALGGRKGANGL